MKLVFLTFAPLTSNAGHLFRLSKELSYLSNLSKVTIMCLNKYPDDQQTKKKYKNVSFYHIPIQFNGWEIVNLSEKIKIIIHLIERINPDLVILQMEVWDFAREISKLFYKRIPFAVVLHAMPFLGTPVNPSGDFNRDVLEYIMTGIEEYRYEYIIKHYKEIKDVLRRLNVIASNKTVAYYLRLYFKNLEFYQFGSMISIKRKIIPKYKEKPYYDFAYMARMEKGKGIEYLDEILKMVSLLLSRQVRLAIMGRPDDVFSKKYLDQLLNNCERDKYFKVDYHGWADEKTKISILSNSGVFLYPSYYDTFSISLYEALSFGLPAIVWDVPFTRFNYSSTKAVIRVPFLNFEEFTKSAIEVFQNRDFLINEALNFINSFKFPDKIAKLDLEIYKKMIKK